MNRADVHAYCLSRKGAKEEFPFGPDVSVYKIKGKMFALLTLEAPIRISLKCDPILAEMLRQTYPAVQPGYHLNKRHWNTVNIDGTIPDDEIWEMIDNSYQLVVKSLSKAQRDQLAALD